MVAWLSSHHSPPSFAALSLLRTIRLEQASFHVIGHSINLKSDELLYSSPLPMHVLPQRQGFDYFALVPGNVSTTITQNTVTHQGQRQRYPILITVKQASNDLENRVCMLTSCYTNTYADGVASSWTGAQLPRHVSL
jgi:hypothetical protein